METSTGAWNIFLNYIVNTNDYVFAVEIKYENRGQRSLFIF